MKAMKMFYKECHLAGREYYDADEAWDELRVGLKVKLVRDVENRYDAEAMAVVYEKLEEESDAVRAYLLGYIPRDENTELAAFFDMGWGDIFECRISRLDPTAHYERQVHLTIRIKKNEEAEKYCDKLLSTK